MKYTHLLLRTFKDSKEYDSVNATLLQKGGFIDQTMAGVYTFLPLGLRVLNNIERIVREEMDTLGSEVLMPALSPISLWETTKRTGIDVLLEARGANESSRTRNPGRYILNPTHEEIITPILKRYKVSYKDLPCAIYQIQTKFRNEERPKSGLMRGREFRMKDMYSFHATEEDRKAFYAQTKESYMKIYARLGIGDRTIPVFASGGDFSDSMSEEFQTICDTGEDEIYIDEDTNTAYNKEVVSEEKRKTFKKVFASEVGNIFDLGVVFSDAFDYTYLDEKGERNPVRMGSYGIGTTRLMGVIVETCHDERGIVWPESIAPYTVYLAPLQEHILDRADEVYEALRKAGINVLYDDRVTSPGSKLADADLLGIPYRAVLSDKAGDRVEIKKRHETDASLMDPDSFIHMLAS